MSKTEMVTLLMTVMRDNHGFSKLGAKNSKDFQYKTPKIFNFTAISIQNTSPLTRSFLKEFKIKQTVKTGSHLSH